MKQIFMYSDWRCWRLFSAQSCIRKTKETFCLELHDTDPCAALVADAFKQNLLCEYFISSYLYFV
jgi:hypothetical protein